MNRDPFYNDIVKGLEGTLDPTLFEECVVALLTDRLPVAAIPGGGDSGMDGAIADMAGQAFPLITTSSKDAIGNLTRNLRSYIDAGGPRRRAVFATARPLTPQRRANLVRRAEELGFELVQVFEQSGIATLLYRHPEWCRELLGLAGDLPALSVVPLSTRGIIDATIGRGEAAAWLRTRAGDLVLVGQPGSGKTHLLAGLANEGLGLFLSTDDIRAVPPALRASQPPAVLVDDAHVNLELLRRLMAFRHQGADFRIVATTWPEDRLEATIATLGIPAGSVLELGLLTRDEIVEVVSAAGLLGPNDLVREIVDQAAGRPGLATFLCSLCLKGGVREVVLGEALKGVVDGYLRPIAGENAVALLACFALGGEAGMTLDDVARHLGISILDASRLLAESRAAGVLSVAGSGEATRFSVRPEALRYVLVRDALFGNVPIPVDALLKRSPDAGETAITLIGASLRGASISDEKIRQLVESADSPRAWAAYAISGREQAVHSLDARSDLLSSLAPRTLLVAPAETIPLLLSTAIGDDRAQHSHPEHPIRALRDWTKGTVGEAVSRRADLVVAAEAWLSAGGDAGVALAAMTVALSPGFESGESDPGMGRTLTMKWGLLEADTVREIGGLWPKVVDVLEHHREEAPWADLVSVATDWVHPVRIVDRKPPAETAEVMRQVAVSMVVDLARVADGYPGVLQAVADLAHDLDIAIDVEQDQDFSVLFPEEDLTDWTTESKRLSASVEGWVEQVLSEGPKAVANRLLRAESEAARLGKDFPRFTPYAAEVLAQRVEDVAPWGEALADAGLPPDVLLPLLKASVSAASSGAGVALLTRCVRDEYQRWAAVIVLLSMEEPSWDLLGEVGPTLPAFKQLVHTLCLRREVPEETLRWLLSHADVAVALEAATAEWSCKPKGEVRDEVRVEWEEAILRADTKSRRIDDYWLGQVLASDSELAAKWLKRRLGEDGFFVYFDPDDGPVGRATSALSLGQRRELIGVIPDGGRMLDGFALSLVGEEPEVFRELLERADLESLHMAPLQAPPGEAWPSMVRAALNAGYSKEVVARSCLDGARTWSGEESAMWERLADAFRVYLADEDVGVSETAAAVISAASVRRDAAAERERLEQIEGW